MYVFSYLLVNICLQNGIIAFQISSPVGMIREDGKINPYIPLSLN